MSGRRGHRGRRAGQDKALDWGPEVRPEQAGRNMSYRANWRQELHE